MRKESICCPPANEALRRCGEILSGVGLRVSDTYRNGMTHLIEPVPTPKGYPEEFLSRSDNPITICGGNIDPSDYETHRVVDFLKDPYYLAANAAITAEAALGLVLKELKCEITSANILILGWGRIGKCLTHQLHHLNARVTVYARKDADRAMLRALGYRYCTREELDRGLGRFCCVINTIPAPVLPADAALRPGCLKLELASGLWLPGQDVVLAHGLPGRCKPEASGTLIAKTIAYHLGGKL